MPDINLKKKKSKNVEGVEEGLIGESIGKAGRTVWMKSPYCTPEKSKSRFKEAKERDSYSALEIG